MVATLQQLSYFIEQNENEKTHIESVFRAGVRSGMEYMKEQLMTENNIFNSCDLPLFTKSELEKYKDRFGNTFYNTDD